VGAQCAAHEDGSGTEITLDVDMERLPSITTTSSLRSLPMMSMSSTVSFNHQDWQDYLELPLMDTFPSDASIKLQQEELLKSCREFAIKWQAGSSLKQIISNDTCLDSHVQLMEDLMAVRIDQSSGLVIEFPLRNVSKVYRMVKYKKWWRSPNVKFVMEEHVKKLAQHVVIIEVEDVKHGKHTKIAFAFPTPEESLNFSNCFSLLLKTKYQSLFRDLRII